MTAQQARSILHLGTPVSIVGITYELKKSQRNGTVVKLEDDALTSSGVGITVKVPDGRRIVYDAGWIHTGGTLSDLLYRFNIQTIFPPELWEGHMDPLTPSDIQQVEIYYRGY